MAANAKKATGSLGGETDLKTSFSGPSVTGDDSSDQYMGTWPALKEWLLLYGQHRSPGQFARAISYSTVATGTAGHSRCFSFLMDTIIYGQQATPQAK